MYSLPSALLSVLESTTAQSLAGRFPDPEFAVPARPTPAAAVAPSTATPARPSGSYNKVDPSEYDAKALAQAKKLLSDQETKNGRLIRELAHARRGSPGGGGGPRERSRDHRDSPRDGRYRDDSRRR